MHEESAWRSQISLDFSRRSAPTTVRIRSWFAVSALSRSSTLLVGLTTKSVLERLSAETANHERMRTVVGALRREKSSEIWLRHALSSCMMGASRWREIAGLVVYRRP